MSIDYEAVLKDSRVRKALGRNGVAQAAEDEDYLPNLILDEATDVLTLGWDGDAPGCSGANWIIEWHGQYFFRSSDLEDEGPFASVNDALALEYFDTPTANPELTSKVLPMRRLLGIGRGLLHEEGQKVLVNEHLYVLRDGTLTREA